MKADYINWMPKGMVYGFIAAAVGVMAAFAIVTALTTWTVVKIVLGAAAVIFIGMAIWAAMMHSRFSYNGKRQMSKWIIEGTAEYVKIPDGGRGLDVGCGSGALTIACAKRNPNATFVGIDRWGKEYASFSKTLCENNARAEGVSNIRFLNGDATKLSFEDETFDAVTSNYVYHNITGFNKQDLLLETLRTLKKGGTFAIHDIMSQGRYGDMQAFADRLRSEGFREVNLIRTDDGKFMSKFESKWMGLSGSTLLVGIK